MSNQPTSENHEVYDMSENAENLANVDYILGNIIPILEYSKRPDIKKMRLNDYAEYKLHMEARYPKFSDSYYSVFQKVISGEDLSPLLKMLAMVNNIKKNKCSLDDAEKMVMDQLGKSFIK